MAADRGTETVLETDANLSRAPGITVSVNHGSVISVSLYCCYDGCNKDHKNRSTVKTSLCRTHTRQVCLKPGDNGQRITRVVSDEPNVDTFLPFFLSGTP